MYLYLQLQWRVELRKIQDFNQFIDIGSGHRDVVLALLEAGANVGGLPEVITIFIIITIYKHLCTCSWQSANQMVSASIP